MISDDLAAAVARLGGSHRDGQDRLAEAVDEAFRTGNSLFAQAGTGTGKTLAYLVPAVAQARSGNRVIIATATLALQRQILDSDLPVAAGEEPVDAAALKGWGNYLCKHKIAGAYPDAELDLGDATTDLGRQVVRVREWAEETTTGDRDELERITDRAWAQVSVNALECVGPKCPMRAECFAVAAHTAAMNADLVVTNHTLLALAATGSPGVLPDADFIVADEAHDLVARVTSADSVTTSGTALAAIAAGAKRAGADTKALDDAAAILGDALAGIDEGTIATPTEALRAALLLAADAARAANASLPKDTDAASRKVAQSRLVVAWEVLDRLAAWRESDVHWLDRDGPPVLHAAPLDVAAVLGPYFADKTLVATSATLQIGGSFEPFAATVGITDRTDLDVGSPFDYRKQGVLYAAAHLPKPAQLTPPEQLDEIVDLVTASGGGTLGLFSSRAAADRAAEHVLAHTDLRVLRQGEDSLAALVKAFVADESACLFGTIGLWQGIDAPGATCRLVIIDRIPFPRPDDPVWSARARRADESGRSGFMTVSVPQAALLLAQGAGRLIRSTADRGVVAILDSRIASARYGVTMVRTLPPFWATTSKQTVLDVLTRLRPA